MIPDEFIWPIWASAFLVPWMGLYAAFPTRRKTMLWGSMFTTPFGLTEPLFVPDYWNPPSLFGLAQKTGFDLESLIFCFAIGGAGTVLYNAMTGRRLATMPSMALHDRRHRHHAAALVAPFIAFPILYVLPWNPIYPGIVAMAIGAVATVLCRPDLLAKLWRGGALFVVYYAMFLFGLEWSAPGYIERVWNLAALSGVSIAGLPLEELLFAAAFGAYWSGVYEHFTWRAVARERSGPRGALLGDGA